MCLTQPVLNAVLPTDDDTCSFPKHKDYKNEMGLDFPRNDAADEDNGNKKRRLNILMPSVHLHLRFYFNYFGFHDINFGLQACILLSYLGEGLGNMNTLCSCVSFITKVT